MHIAAIRSAQSLGMDGTPSRWRSTRLRSLLTYRWYRKSEESKRDSPYRLDDRLLADVALYREHRIHNPQNRTDQQQASPLPVALLAMWMPRI
jgi:hypothetical protein